MPQVIHRLELDLDVFAGPFDLLLSLVLREELDLLEVELAEVVLAYVEHLEATEELDERMLQYLRFRGAGAWLTDAHTAGQAYLGRVAPLPAALRRVEVAVNGKAHD